MSHSWILSFVQVFKKCPLLIVHAAAKSLQSCPTLCNPTDGSPPGSAVPGILLARTLEWVGHFLLQHMKVKSESEVAQSCRLLVTSWTAAYQAPLSMGFSRQMYWSGVPLPSLVNCSYFPPKRFCVSVDFFLLGTLSFLFSYKWNF